jgi:DNA-binding sugar fermentation-stimulating protein
MKNANLAKLNIPDVDASVETRVNRFCVDIKIESHAYDLLGNKPQWG